MKNSSIKGNPLDSPQRLLMAYEDLLARSTRMLACVRERDWFTLVEEQTCYVIEVELISKVEGGIELSEAEKQCKAALLEKILQQDMEIRQRLLERREELRKQMGVERRRHNLARSYGFRRGFDEGHR